MKKIVAASRAKAVLKWIFSVFFVIGVSIFVNDAFIRDVTTLDAGIFMVFMSVLVTSNVAQWTGDPMDRIVTVSFAGAIVTEGQGAPMCRTAPRLLPRRSLAGEVYEWASSIQFWNRRWS